MASVAVRKERRAVREDGERAEWLEDHGSTPLGVGMPSGAPVRLDGESHSVALRRLLREDVCAYCGGPGGTVDHIVPRSTGVPGVERWVNLIGACQPCNERKRDRSLLRFLLQRAEAADARKRRRLRQAVR